MQPTLHLPRRTATLALAMALALAAGCQPWLARSSPLSTADASLAERQPLSAPPSGLSSGDLAAIRDGQWIRAARTPDGVEPAHRWRHPAIDEMLARPAARRPDFAAVATNSATPLPVAASAAVALARLGCTDGAAVLASAAGDRTLKVQARCAAVEALGLLPANVSVSKLRELTDEHGRYIPGQAVPYAAELHAELIQALARHVEPADDPRFQAAATSPSAQVRAELARAWSRATHGEPPMVLLGDTDPRVRAASLLALARCRPAQAEQAVAAALNDSQLEVRLAAVAAVGRIGGPWAEQTLRAMGPESPEWIRAAVARAWAEMGQEAPLAEAAKDEAWRVRLAVAESLARFPTASGAALARRLLDDPSTEVRERAVRSAADWPLPLAGPVLLEGMTSPAWQVRQASAEALAARWPPAAEFPVRSDAAQRSASHTQLTARFEAEFGPPTTNGAPVAHMTADRATDAQIAEVAACLNRLDGGDPEQQAETLARLRALGPVLPDALGRLVEQRGRAVPEVLFREVLPQCDPAFAELRVLADGTVEDRRHAIGSLAQQIEQRPLGPLAVERLAAIVALDADQVVWLGALRLVEHDGSEAANGLALVGLGDPSPEVRAEACRHLAGHPRPKCVSALLPLLADPSRPVVLAAVAALGRTGAKFDTAPLRTLLVEPNETLQAELADALLRLGDPAGEAALERLAYSADPSIARRVAEIMGQQPRPAFLPALRHLLDGPTGVRLAALESLPRVAGAEPPGLADATTEQRLRAWKEWLEQATSSKTL